MLVGLWFAFRLWRKGLRDPSRFREGFFLCNSLFSLLMHTRLTTFLLFFCLQASGQTLGGNSVFNFLKLPHTPQLTALGGVNVSQASDDAGMAYNNPALFTPAMHTQMNAVFNSFYSGIKVYHLSMGYRHEKSKTNFIWGLNYFNYGNATETDPSGNVLGRFRPTDWVMQVSASRKYLEKWHYGASLKFINSSYGQYRSTGLATDVGILFKDTANLFTAGVQVKNLGMQLKKYGGTEPDDLPFDLQIGFTKRLASAPFGFSVTAQRAHRFDIVYNDTVYNNENGFANSSTKKFSFSKLINHFVLAATIYGGDRVEINAGYNFLRRNELSIGNSANGLNGFSMGAGVLLGKLQVRYARAYYQGNTAYNQLGLNLKLNGYFGLGRLGQKVGW